LRRNLLPLGVLQTANIEFTSAAFLRLVERIIGTSHNQEALSPEGCLLFACRLGGPLMKKRLRWNSKALGISFEAQPFWP